MEIITIVGARPQFVKAAVVSREISKHADIRETIVHTGQHFDPNMSNLFFEEMCIPHPTYNLNINNLGHGAMTGKMLEEIEKILLDRKPDWVLVYGDTNSTLACPTETAIENLRQEGFDHFPTRIVTSGDVMLDAALFYQTHSRPPKVELSDHFVLATLHRAENTDHPQHLMDIIHALETISQEQEVICPLHPRTRSKLETQNYDTKNSPIHFIEPVGYLEMLYLLNHCSLVMTDSGGLQKESFFFKKYCITLRNETEWTELVENGYNSLAGNSYEVIMDTYRKYHVPNFSKSLYGNGHAAKIIVDTLIHP